MVKIIYKITIPFRIILILFLFVSYGIFRNIAACAGLRFGAGYYGKIILLVFGLKLKLHESIRAIQKKIPGTIIIANHSSNMDIYAVMSLCHSVDPIWIAKIELKSVFRNSFIKRRWGIIFVDRKSRGNYERISEELKTYPPERPVIIFPQGGFESVDENGLVFRSGFACLAAHTGRAVLPVAITGLDTLCVDPAYTPNRSGKFSIKVGTSFRVADCSDESIQRAVQHGKKEVEKMLFGKS